MSLLAPAATWVFSPPLMSLIVTSPALLLPIRILNTRFLTPAPPAASIVRGLAPDSDVWTVGTLVLSQLTPLNKRGKLIAASPGVPPVIESAFGTTTTAVGSLPSVGPPAPAASTSLPVMRMCRASTTPGEISLTPTPLMACWKSQLLPLPESGVNRMRLKPSRGRLFSPFAVGGTVLALVWLLDN